MLVAVSVFGVFHGVRLYRADVKLPTDLALALEVGATRTTAVGSLVDRMGIRWAPLVLRLMGPKQVARKRRQIDMAGNPAAISRSTVTRPGARCTGCWAPSAPSRC